MSLERSLRSRWVLGGRQLTLKAELLDLLKRAEAGDDPKVISFLQDTRKYCPKCEREMFLRTGKGEKQFWGCSAYPKCRFTMPAD